MENLKHFKPLPNILIIGSTPYRRDDQSRSQISYFFNYPKENLFQVFSNSKPPKKGLCGNLFQITDKELFSANKNPGKEYTYESINDSSIEEKSSLNYFKKSKHSTLRHIVRYLLWHKKRWVNEKFINFVKKANPDVIFLIPSDDYYIFDIYDEVRKIKSCKTIVSIVDDYYFSNKKKYLFVPKALYWKKYLAKYYEILNDDSTFLMYVSNKMKNDYDRFFNKDGKVIHISTDLKIEKICFSKSIDKLIYAGSTGLGRCQTLLSISKVLANISPSSIIYFYPNRILSRELKTLRKRKNIQIMERLSYDDLLAEYRKADCIMLIEELKNKKNILKTKYSLSTKTADAISSGKRLLIVGNKETGLLSYFQSICIYPVFTDISALSKENLEYYLTPDKEQKRINELSKFAVQNTSTEFLHLLNYLTKIL